MVQFINEMIKQSHYILILIVIFVISFLPFGCGAGRIVKCKTFDTIETIIPEQFGAVGDGIADDTEALRKAFSANKQIVLTKKYLISKSLLLKTSVIGVGTIMFGKDGVSINCTGNDLTIRGITFDYQGHYGRMLKLTGATNVTIEGCEFVNVGTTSQDYSNGMLVISGGCSEVVISSCRFLHCKSSLKSSAQGIWIQQKSPKLLNHHICVRSCYFEDFQTIEDADAIKVLGGNYDCHLYVDKCEFHKCAKRAMKFQGRECHSSNNSIYVTEPMHCAIAFQRGYGSSTNDTVIIDYDGKSEINENAGLLYRAITISQGHVAVEGFNMIANKSVINNHQAAIGLVAYGEEDTKVTDVVIRNSLFSNGGVFMKVSDKVKDVDALKIRETEFVDQQGKPVFNLQNANVKNTEVDMAVLSTKGNMPHSGLSAQIRNINKINVRKK